MSTARKAGTIEKAIGAGQSMVMVTRMVMNTQGKTIMTVTMGTGTTIMIITEMATITVTSSMAA